MSKHEELRCFCAHTPLLAVYGVSEQGELYIHVRIWKQNRIYGEIYITGDSKVQLLCRDCYRWHRIKVIQPDRAVLQESTPPAFAERQPSNTGLRVI